MGGGWLLVGLSGMSQGGLLPTASASTTTPSASASPAGAAPDERPDGPRSAKSTGATSDGVAEAEREAAQRLAEAQVLAIEGRWEQARLVFLQAYAVHPTSVVLWDLAVAEIKSEHFLDAAQHLQQYRKHPSAEPEKLARLDDYMGRVYARVGRLQVDAPVTAVLWLDGARTEWSADSPVVAPPGEHTVTLTYGDQRVEQKVTLAPGAADSVSLRAPPPAPSASAAEPALVGRGLRSSDFDVNPATHTNAGSPARTVTVIAGATLAVASGVVGTVFALRGWSATTDAADQKDALGPASCTTPSLACDRLAKTNADAHKANLTAGIAFLAAGGFGALTLGTLLVWRTPRSSSLGVGADSSSLWITGTF